MGYLASFCILTLSLLAGCAGSGCYATAGNPSITPATVSTAGNHIGDLVQWGGTLLEVRHLRDSTELEVAAHPLDGCGRPRQGSGRIGHFIIEYPGFLETVDYQTGRGVSAIGRIAGIRTAHLQGVDSGLPILESYEIHLWSDQQLMGLYSRPWVNIGIGGGSGSVYGGVGVLF
jgi:outer membrane lipoprotein